MRRIGSAAPHSNWSPTVNAVRYSRPIASLRTRPIGTFKRAADRRGRSSRDRRLARRSARRAPSRCRRASSRSISASGRSRFNLIVSAWLWQRIAPMRTQMPSTGIARRAVRPRILLVSALRLPFFAALAVAQVLVDPGDQAAGERRAEVLVRQLAPTQRARSRRDRCRGWRGRDRRSSAPAAACSAPICCDQLAHVLRTGARGSLVGHRRDPLDELRPGTGRPGPSSSTIPCSCRRCSRARPRSSAASMTSRLTGSRMMTASSFMRSAEAASIQ